MDNITSQEYWAEIQSIAAECAQADEPRDAVHEACDQHQWITYTFYNLQVLQHSRNESAYFDENGRSPETTDFSTLTAVLACWAMLQDVHEAMMDLPKTA
jgi:hypothetical protein